MRGARKLLGIAFIVALLAGLVACQPTESTTPAGGKAAAPAAGQAVGSTPSAAATPEGTLRVGLSQWGDGLADPPVARSQDKAQLTLLFDWLVGAAIDGSDISPDTGIASKWEQAPDGMTWTFNIRKGVQFHDGYGEVTADDVKFSIERVMFSPKSKADFASMLKDAIDKVEVVDPYTVRFSMKKPTVTLPYDLSPIQGTEGIVVSKKHIEKVGEDEFTRHPVGSGPYKFAELSTGSYLKLLATDKHFAIGVPKFKEVYVQLVQEESTRMSMLKTGELDLIDVSIDRVGELEKDFLIGETVGGADLIVYFLAQWQGALADKRVRQAVDLAIDKETLLRTIFRGKGSVLPGFMVPSWSVGAKPLKAHPYDPDKARALLQEAGHSNLELDLPTTPQDSMLIEAVAGQLQKAGFKTKVTKLDMGAVVAKYRTRSAVLANPPLNAIHVYYRQNLVFPLSAYAAAFKSNGSVPTVQDPKLDALIDGLARAKTTEEYGSKVGSVQEYMDKEFIAAPILVVNNLFGANPKKLQKWNAGGKVTRDPGLRELVWRGK